ncbi:hypothetical protein [Chryseoglobus sp. 28M-23]|uniref:hypothetical protein n=1 Tax=Chryseoglobus sp. 28M-23 TaxID=2772253 RepID=UPI001746FE5D|nr:hypothetical protein [Chryseoglobus sp. 28M-23]QOD93484.1 hypothetical protein IE160_11355 [Chryseoglobus sp. 28M-23]
MKKAFGAIARDRKPLTPNARLVLLWMALTALDNDAKPVYFAVRESTAIALGRMLHDPVDIDDPRHAEISRERDSVFRMVQRALSELVDRGYIKRRKRGQKWQHAEYELTLPSVVVDEQSVHPENEQAVHPEANESFARAVLTVHPKEPRGTTEEPRGGETAPSEASHVSPVENAKHTEEAA